MMFTSAYALHYGSMKVFLVAFLFGHAVAVQGPLGMSMDQCHNLVTATHGSNVACVVSYERPKLGADT